MIRVIESQDWIDTASETSSHPNDQQHLYSRNKAGDSLYSQQYYYPRNGASSQRLPVSDGEVYHNHTYAASRNVTASDVAAAVKARQPSRRLKSEGTDEESMASEDSEETQFSRDEKRARSLNIPIPTCDIINLPIDEFSQKAIDKTLGELEEERAGVAHLLG